MIICTNLMTERLSLDFHQTRANYVIAQKTIENALVLLNRGAHWR